LGGRFTAATSVLPLIEQTTRLSEQSGGLFNPAFGALFQLWGFQSDDPPMGPPPSAEDIARVLAFKPRMSDLRVHGIEVESTNPHLRLDFGAYAQGYAADRVIERFRERGIRNAIVNVSGDVRVIGGHADGRAWRIGIRNPRGEGVLASVLMQGDESLVTSGDYERYFMHEGKRYHHILDPRTGYPSRGVTSVTVLHRSAAVADAAATALMIAGVDEWRAVARRMGVVHALLVDDQGRVHMDAATAKRVKFEIEPAPAVILSEEIR
jgi:thiamine biosynthesis lipoprotein